MGFLGRKYGLTCDNLISFKLLTANEDHILFDKKNYPDLFWYYYTRMITLSFAQAYHIPEVIIFELRWDFDKLYKVLMTYFNWLRNDNSVGIEMDIFSLTMKNPILITGIYAGRQSKL